MAQKMLDLCATEGVESAINGVRGEVRELRLGLDDRLVDLERSLSENFKKILGEGSGQGSADAGDGSDRKRQRSAGDFGAKSYAQIAAQKQHDLESLSRKEIIKLADRARLIEGLPGLRFETWKMVADNFYLQVAPEFRDQLLQRIGFNSPLDAPYLAQEDVEMLGAMMKPVAHRRLQSAWSDMQKAVKDV
ncbi:hypothetical protein B484DRAFT_457011 [Ochromonadaceae sp. CCMP2298]|nr:hypothetical protein B484DRAFT_457011 [Ochromonadaceae sp. CCMP2298]